MLFEKFMKLNILDVNESIKAPAGGLLLQGSVEQIIEDTVHNQLSLVKIVEG